MSRPSRVHPSLSVLVIGVAACGSRAPADDDGAAVEVVIAAVSMPDVEDAVWDLEVTQADGAPVFRTRITSGVYGDARGSATYVGPCVAGEDNVVNLWLRGIYTSEAPLAGPPGDFHDATPDDGSVLAGSADFVNPGRLTRRVPCVANADAQVRFDVTVMRPARQGFFDIVVDFNDIFCSAKIDTGLVGQDGICRENLLLHNPDDQDRRDRTYVLAFACTAGPDAQATALYLDDIEIACEHATITIDPSTLMGNRRIDDVWTGVTIAPGTATLEDHVYQVTIYRGDEVLGGLRKRYWNVAIGAAAPGYLEGCSLTTKASADDAVEPVAIGRLEPRTIESGLIYPYLAFDVPDLGVCAAYPIGAEPGEPGTSPVYTRPTDPPLDFDHRYPEEDVAVCGDGVMNGEETDVDCGGDCDPCADGGGCAIDADCRSGLCTAGVCAASACDDGLQNGLETDVDCGGSCPPCGAGLRCETPEDCALSLVCWELLCRPETCFDSELNQDETDVDCGGVCPACADGLGCEDADDCESGVCTAGTCSAPTCVDGVMNGDELGTDCGGACPACVGVIAMSTGFDHTCAVRDDGTVYCWGVGDYGQLGNGTEDNAWSPTQVPGLDDMTTISCGNRYTCAVRSDGTLWCWGRGLYGRLGHGSTDSSFLPVQVVGPGTAPALLGVVGVTTGNRATCAHLDDGTAWRWGQKFSGQLGIGSSTTMHRTRPVQVLGEGGVGVLGDVVVLTNGRWEGDHVCALTTTGSAFCWGLNSRRQLGDLTATLRTAPVRVLLPEGGPMTGVVSIAAGHDFTCAARADGSAWCWGFENSGQRGDGPGGAQASDPIRVRGRDGVGLLEGVTRVTVNYIHACAVHADGTLSCWGANGAGELGNGVVGPFEAVPNQVVGPGGVGFMTAGAQISAGADHTCAVQTNGLMWCWGTSSRGRLGIGVVPQGAHPHPEAVLWP